MFKIYFHTAIFLTLLGSFGCQNSGTSNLPNDTSEKPVNTEIDTLQATRKGEQNLDSFSEFIPKSYIIFDKKYGDLNKDGVEDCVLIIKGTDKSKIVKDEYRGALDRNRRGIIVLFRRNSGYEMALKNQDCFASENEDGGVYFAPDLEVELKKGNLYIRYAHGRYGYWMYTFRYQNADFELIGYDASDNMGPTVNSVVSINYMTRKKVVKNNTHEDTESGEEVFNETTTKIDVATLAKLSEIKDFQALDILGY